MVDLEGTRTSLLAVCYLSATHKVCWEQGETMKRKVKQKGKKTKPNQAKENYK